MDLLTVTCWRDRQQFQIQLSSIEKYLKGYFKHFIVVNDDFELITKNKRKRWAEMIGKAYKDKIDYEIIFAKWDQRWNSHLHITAPSSRVHGWRSQQIYKFWFYDRIKKDYVILDSKNFFIRTCSIEDFQNMIGSGKIFSAHPTYSEINQVYADFFKTDLIEPLAPWTPFVVEYDVLKNFGDPDKIARTLCQLQSTDGAWPSEFIWYSYLIKNRLKESSNIVNSSIVWMIEHLPMVLDEAINDESIKIVGIHRTVLEKLKMNKKPIKELENFFLCFKLPSISLGIKSSFRYKKKNLTKSKIVL